jgi:hypothetical protein
MNRFLRDNETVVDTQTGLMWTTNASLLEFPLAWGEALHAIQALNQSGLYGYDDWKLPNRRELFSLISFQTTNPCVPGGHPFTHIFTGYYWTSSSCARLPDQAWYIHLGGARVFKGMKHGSYMVWPVRMAENRNLSRVYQTGQKNCYDEGGVIIDCRHSGQDGEFQSGLHYDTHRFKEDPHVIYDRATGLTWLRNANVHRDPMDWASASHSIRQMNRESTYGYNDWRFPNIIELESVTDIGRHSPALSAAHLFEDVQDFYWSSTTSMYDTSYAWVLYTKDGIIGVGHKPLSEFYVWPVRGNEIPLVG